MIDANGIATALEDYFVFAVVLTCFVIGYLIKHYTKLPNNYIPLLMIAAGIISNVVITINGGAAIINYSVLLSGGVSGLASCGLYDLIAKSIGLQITNKKEESNTPQTTESPEPEDYNNKPIGKR